MTTEDPIRMEVDSNTAADESSFACMETSLQQQQQQPVLIPIRFPNDTIGDDDDDSDIPEWAMIEINGELLPPLEESPEATTTSDVDDTERTVQFEPGTIELGAVSFRGKTPILVIGTHELQGKVEDLAEPFVCLEPAVADKSINLDGASTGTSYAITGVVRKKLLFNQYPKTLLR